jgi:glycerol uptake facilitator-like aquaporin
MSAAFSSGRRLAAEALGTGLLVAAVVGSGIMAESLAGGNVAIALLGNTLPTGAILVVLILALGPISGAHFNPAVSLVMGITGALPWRQVGPYMAAHTFAGIAPHHVVPFVAAQVAGALAGMAASRWLLQEVPSTGRSARIAEGASESI